MNSNELDQHVFGTYISLRIGMGVIATIFPIIIVAGGYLLIGQELLDSMSAYYHSGMRNIFVGFLFAIGAFLYLYKGFSSAENIALNLAGLFAIGIAIFPMSCSGDSGCNTFTAPKLHAICALVFFSCMAYVSWFRADDTLSLLKIETRIGFKKLYSSLAVLLVLSPLAAIVAAYVTPLGQPGKPVVFWVEAFAIWCFAAYWLTKSRELSMSHAERLALDARLATPSRSEHPVASSPPIQ